MRKQLRYEKDIETSNGHCWLTFNNGYTISIFNGFGSYSENHYNWELGINKLKKKEEQASKSDDCEIAIIYDGEFCTRNFIDTNDSVKGYISADELADIIYKVKNYKEKQNEISNKQK